MSFLTQFFQTLFKIAKTTLSSKIVRASHDHFANLALEAVMRLKVRFPPNYSLFLVIPANFCCREAVIWSAFK
jgi:chaperonin GroEL (HSP60 family)